MDSEYLFSSYKKQATACDLHKYVCICVFFLSSCKLFHPICMQGDYYYYYSYKILSSKLRYPICKQVFFLKNKNLGLWGGGIWGNCRGIFLKKIVLLSELSAGCFAHGQSMRGVFHCDLFFFFFQVQNWGFSLPQGIGLCPNRTINIS